MRTVVEVDSGHINWGSVTCDTDLADGWYVYGDDDSSGYGDGPSDGPFDTEEEARAAAEEAEVAPDYE